MRDALGSDKITKTSGIIQAKKRFKRCEQDLNSAGLSGSTANGSGLLKLEYSNELLGDLNDKFLSQANLKLKALRDQSQTMVSGFPKTPNLITYNKRND